MAVASVLCLGQLFPPRGWRFRRRAAILLARHSDPSFAVSTILTSYRVRSWGRHAPRPVMATSLVDPRAHWPRLAFLLLISIAKVNNRTVDLGAKPERHPLRF